MKKPNKALASIAIASMALTMTPFNVLAAGAVPIRISGYTAEQTAVQIAEQTGWTGTAMLASSTSYGMVDALTAGPLASYLKAPILLTGSGNFLNADTQAELAKLKVTTIFVTSGTGVISQGVLDQLTGMGITIVPLGGVDRFATATNIANKMVEYGAKVSKVAVAYGWKNQDALSIAAIASAQSEPILLTEKDSLPASAREFLSTNTGVILASDVIGGTGVISEDVIAQLPSATRHFGNTAYDTNLAVLKEFDSVLKYDNVFLANGETAIDALAGAPLAANYKAGIVLTNGVNNGGTAYVGTKLNSNSVVTALGGSAVVPETVRTGIASNAPAAVGGGGGGGGFFSAPVVSNPPVVNNPAVTSAEVSDVTTLNAAVNNPNITKITLTNNITQDLTIPRSLTIDFGAYTLHGNVTFQHLLDGTSKLTGTAATSIDGNLTVDTQNASFENSANVGGNVNIVNVKVGTWTELANGNTLIITDDDGAVITIDGNPGSITVNEDADNDIEGKLQITINPGHVVNSITLNSPADITVSAGATLNAFTAGTGSSDSTITNNGIIDTVTTNVHINLVANVLPNKIITGANGTITATGTAAGSNGSAVMALLVVDTTAPELSSTGASAITDATATLNFSTDEAGTYYYLVYAAADPAPDAATVKALGSSIAKGKAAIAVGAKTVNLTGLTASTAYRTYVVVIDAAENSSAVSMIGLTTVAATVPPVVGAAVEGLNGVFQVGEVTTAAAITTEEGAGAWKSSSPAVATVDGSTGKITPIAAGTTTISYTTSTSGLVNSKIITVYGAAVVTNPMVGLIHVGSGNITPTGFVTAMVGQTIAWTSSAPSIATIDQSSGVITPGVAGSTTISYAVVEAATGKIVAKGSMAITVHVVGAVITGLDVPIHVMQMGQTTTAQAITADLVGGTWTSSAPSIATVDGTTGFVTALSPGKTTIAYTSPSGNVNSQQITVNPEAIVANPAIGTVRVGSPGVTPTGFTPPGAGLTMTWTSSDPTKATINGITGVITPVAVGNTTISYSVIDFSTGKIVSKGSTEITVQAPALPGAVTGVSLNKSSIVLLVGHNETLVPTVLPSDANNKGVTWSSNKPQFATVDSNGMVVGVKLGEITNITVTTNDGNYSTTCSALVVTEAIAAGAFTQAGGLGMADIIALYGPALGLDLTAYNALSSEGKSEVQSALSTGPGFTNGADIQAAINGVIAARKEPAAPNVSADDVNNIVIGMATGMEYMLDGDGYYTYDSTIFGAINLSGDHTLLVRLAKNGPIPASADTELSFTDNLGAVVKTALTNAITAATTNTTSAAISVDGSDVLPTAKWVTQGVMTTYTDAIAVAQLVEAKLDATQAQVNGAIITLATATTAFNNAKADGTQGVVVSKAALTNAITAATTNTTSAAISVDGSNVLPTAKWVTQGVMTTYTDAIAVAQLVEAKLDATQAQVNGAIITLATATTAFNNAKADGTQGVVVSKVALTNAITAATTNTSTTSAAISVDGSDVMPANQWVTQEVMTTYTAAITAAQVIEAKLNATQAEVDGAVTTLAAATNAFNTAKKAGTMIM